MSTVNRYPEVPSAPRAPLPTPRIMVGADISALLKIERKAFGDRAWSQGEFLRACGGADDRALVVSILNQPAGYVLYRLEPSTLRIVRFATADWCADQRVASTLLGSVLARRSPQRPRVAMNVPESLLLDSPPLQRLVRRIGLRAVCTLTGRDGEGGTEPLILFSATLAQRQESIR